jgi:CheY-like chemotaxis protein
MSKARCLVASRLIAFGVVLVSLLGQALVIVSNQIQATKAVEIAEDWQPEVVLLDLLMPGMDGFEVAARLRADVADTKIVAITGLSQDDERVQDAGFDRYLMKPVLRESVSQAIRQLTSD